MRVIGLAGQMAVGKSTVAGHLAAKGAAVLDGDVIAKALAERGKAGWAAIVALFGQGYVLPNGNLDRAALGRTVFADASALVALNALLHPALLAEMERLVAGYSKLVEVCVIDAAVLIEAGIWVLCDAVCLVWASRECQVSRLTARVEGLTAAEAQRRLDAQTAPEVARAFSTYVIDTTGGLDSTLAQVDAMYDAVRQEGRV